MLGSGLLERDVLVSDPYVLCEFATNNDPAKFQIQHVFDSRYPLFT